MLFPVLFLPIQLVMTSADFCAFNSVLWWTCHFFVKIPSSIPHFRLLHRFLVPTFLICYFNSSRFLIFFSLWKPIFLSFIEFGKSSRICSIVFEVIRIIGCCKTIWLQLTLSFFEIYLGTRKLFCDWHPSGRLVHKTSLVETVFLSVYLKHQFIETGFSNLWFSKLPNWRN